MVYLVNLENFQGPFDVLLELLKQKKLDVTSLSISSITNDYLSYIENTELSVEELNWFLVVAAKLTLDKSTAVLSLEPDEEDLNLEESLLRYQKVKALATQLANHLKSQHYSKNAKFHITRPTAPIAIDTIMSAYHEALRQYQAKPKKHLLKSSREMLNKLRSDFIKNLKLTGGISADEIAENARTRSEAIVGLMTILELLKSQDITFKKQQYVMEALN